MLISPEANTTHLPRGAKFARKSALAGLVLAAGVALFAGWQLWSESGASSAPAFETRPAAVGSVERTISATGPVKALVNVEVGTQLSGLIAEMKADFNDRVKAGDLLAVIDRAPFVARLDSATANLEMARAEIGMREAAVERAGTRLAQDNRDKARYEALSPRGVVSQKTRETAQTQSGLALADLSMARANLESAKAAVAQREADVSQAKIDLDRTLIRSPIDGVVVDRRMQPGQTVAAVYQTPILFQIAQDLSQIQISAQVDEADVGAVRPGAPVTFTVEAYPDETFAGVVEQVRLAATKISGVITYTVIIRAQNPDLRLYPDMTATARIVSAERKNALNVPNEALRFRPPGEAAAQGKTGQARQVVVWVPDVNGTLSPRQVRLGLKGDHATEILDGEIKEGDAVALRAKSTSGGEEP
ncbi:MAG: efflux RND transporter periplasmic adaptor subunit [Beijerinckiaceae bacterium]|nr:efflux RND transporter periplasmic adaptor subunit [Beijerinckiaceae bacterium]